MNAIKILCTAGVIILAGCSTTRITSTWKAESFVAKKYNKVMVVGIIREADRTLREKMENHLVGDLKDLGYNAVSSYAVYGPKAFEGMSEEDINKKLAGEKVDAVLTVVLLDKEKERYYVPGRVVYSPYVTYHHRFSGYYHSIYTRIESPGYYNVTTKYFWESNFYDLEGSQLIYSVQTQSFDPSSVQSMAHEYGQKIIASMVKHGVLQKKQENVARAF